MSTLYSLKTLSNIFSSVTFPRKGMISIFNYGFPVSQQNFIDKSVELIYLSEYSLLIDLALAKGFINTSEAMKLKNWRTSPETWGK